ncbi:ribose 5-phosphate isomerase B [bacterium]|nr:ribose 5-phosphate isomerase B [bacterium]MBU4602876.1 ribose 5-phosphate isomerase B [bacterium]
MNLFVGSDNVGYPLKKIITDYLTDKGIKFDDIGVYSENDETIYPEIALKGCLGIREGEYQYGILICGTGIGMSITANKIPGIMAALCNNIYSAERAKESNNANVLTLGRYTVGPELAKKLVDAWLKSEFQGEGSTKKVEKIQEYEKLFLK